MSSAHRIISDEEKNLISDAVQTEVFQDLPDTVGRNHRQRLAIFGAPGLRALSYVLIDGEPWDVDAHLRDIAQFGHPDYDGVVKLTVGSQPIHASWWPDGGCGEHHDLTLVERNPDGGQYVATADGVNHPHIVVGWHEVPKPQTEASDE